MRSSFNKLWKYIEEFNGLLFILYSVFVFLIDAIKSDRYSSLSLIKLRLKKCGKKSIHIISFPSLRPFASDIDCICFVKMQVE